MTHLDPDHVAATALLLPSLAFILAVSVASGIEWLRRSYAARQQRRNLRRHTLN